jgi:RHS repeat-associated protein
VLLRAVLSLSHCTVDNAALSRSRPLQKDRKGRARSIALLQPSLPHALRAFPALKTLPAARAFIVGAPLYTITSMDASHRVLTDGLGPITNGASLINRTYGYDVLGRPTSIQSTSSAVLQNLNYSYYGVGSNQYGNMSQRQDVAKNLTETFGYDGLNRLTSSQVTGQTAVTVSYDSFGNILNKSDRGNYSYGANAGPHAATSIGGVTNTYDANGNYTGTGTSRTVTYDTHDKPLTLAAGPSNSQFRYGPDGDYIERIDAYIFQTADTLYAQNAEIQYNLRSGTSQVRRYLPGGAYQLVSFNAAGVITGTTTEYLLDDHIGSTDVIADASGNVQQPMSFDAWGMRRNPTTWVALTSAANFDNSQTSHGYTGHEMVDNEDIVHMHGRIYDARWGRMLQADPYIQDALDTQAQNRYAYVLNNPLIHTDPTGYCTFAELTGSCTHFSAAANGVVGAFVGGGGEAATFSIAGAIPSVSGATSRSGKGLGGVTDELKLPSSGLTADNSIASLAGKSQSPLLLADNSDFGAQLAMQRAAAQSSQVVVNGRRTPGFEDWQILLPFTMIDTLQDYAISKLPSGLQTPAAVGAALMPTPGGKAKLAKSAASELKKGGTYLLRDAEGQVMRTGRTNDLLRREAEHARDSALSDYSFEVVHRTDVYAEQRGLEQVLHNTYEPPLNYVQPISPSNPNFDNYMKAAQDFLGR